jgi:hypothetical protein
MTTLAFYPGKAIGQYTAAEIILQGTLNLWPQVSIPILKALGIYF